MQDNSNMIRPISYTAATYTSTHTTQTHAHITHYPYLHSQVGHNALHIASANGHLELVKYLLPKFGQKKFDLDENRYTCLTLAIEEKELDVVDYLLQEGGLCVPQQQVSTLTLVSCIMARPLPPLHFVW